MTSPPRSRNRRRLVFLSLLLSLCFLVSPAPATGASVCHGTTSNGSLENGCKLPASGTVRFSTRRSWVRHDEHYHVDFDIPCEPR